MMRIISPHNAASIANRFLALLSSLGIQPLNRGQIESEFLSVTELLDVWNQTQLASQIPEDVLRTAAGVHDFAAKVLAASTLPDFASFRRHLELIGQGTLRTSLSQMEEGYPEDTSRKLVELYVACLAVHCGKQVVLDNPVNSKGDNPDVMFDYGQLRWAIAIKAVSSRHGQTLFENIKKAAEQIDCSAADCGLVLLNVRDSIDYSPFESRVFTSVSDATDTLGLQLDVLAERIEENRTASEWNPIFAGKTKAPVLFMGQVLCRVQHGSLAVPMPVKMIKAYYFREPYDAEAHELALALNHWMQVILEGQPGPPPC